MSSAIFTHIKLGNLFTFSFEEPTAKQLSKASRELTTSLNLKKQKQNQTVPIFHLK